MQLIDGIWQSTVTDDKIAGFFGEYQFLSNFHPAPIDYQGIEFPTSEHLYMALKTLKREDRVKIATIEGPGRVKKFGQTVLLRSDWEDVKVAMMYQAITFKFYQNYNLREKLLCTGDKILEETNYWKDTYWGVCGGVGKNMLGKLLMAFRSECPK